MSLSEHSSTGAPRHVAIIMDGNGRWARERGWLRLKGHEQGARNVRTICSACIAEGVEYLTLYAFSTENWKRPAPEVGGLMLLLERFLAEQVADMNANGVRLAVIGRVEELPAPVLKRLNRAIEETSGNNRLTLTLALNYGGRDEILDAVRSLARDVAAGRVSPEAITAETFESRLHTAGMPDPDLLIRTSGELRLSNFLPWQLSYTEIHVTPVFWPDFGPADLSRAITDYRGRDRRFGGAVENPIAENIPA